MFLFFEVLLFFLFLVNVDSQSDFTIACRKGFKVSGIRRSNSFYQKSVAGSLVLECEKISQKLENITCQGLTTTPQCNGASEGCGGNQWLGGFQAFVIENTTNTVLLDPICCSSESIKIDSLSCASERINNPKEPFEHSIIAEDLVYRGLQCWHQYDSNNTLVDLIWKMEICQYTGDHQFPLRPFSVEHCPPCDCHCGIDVCSNGKEPIRIIHKNVSQKRCACDCHCHYECI
ncbi:hypothetical protein FO519_003246 [Halicephalobus sp. NKZ332]|nr:hypothetical protein FO519_003246 [Halicephalobus sp. NKZ332]